MSAGNAPRKGPDATASIESNDRYRNVAWGGHWPRVRRPPTAISADRSPKKPHSPEGPVKANVSPMCRGEIGGSFVESRNAWHVDAPSAEEMLVTPLCPKFSRGNGVRHAKKIVVSPCSDAHR